jgi:hypothetical protein
MMAASQVEWSRSRTLLAIGQPPPRDWEPTALPAVG